VELQIGDVAPAFTLPDLDGSETSLADFSGKPTMVMFWSPSCVYCQRMVDDLRIFESDRPANAPELLIVSTGDIEANRAAGLNSKILIDSGFATGRAYGASGTPSGVLVDGEGKVAATLVVGGPKILSALGYVSPTCQECLDNCKQQGGGDACRTVCQMGGQCA
jgi:peroxiredoxin